MAKTVVKIKELAQLGTPVDISDTEQIMVRALSLKEMVTLFIESKDVFISLYSVGLEGPTVEVLAPFLLSAPDVVARIIALASDEPESAAVIEQRLPATVQLIALAEIWSLSVPDPKKARELLSEVTALLQKLKAKGEFLEAQKISSPTTLPPE